MKTLPINEPLCLSVFMGQALKAYYTKADAIGSKGDFITAPEISQLFGESIGLWILSRLMADHPSKPYAFAELGPGRGVLLKDVLRVLNLRPELLKPMALHAVEIHPTFRELQKKATAPQSIQHHDSIKDLLKSITPQPLYLICNEFFDTYPIEQYIFEKNRWLKRAVVFDGTQYNWTTLETSPPNLDNYTSPQEGDIVEICPKLLSDYHLLQDYISKHGGALLSIDYGYQDFLYGDTFQGLSKHKFVDPLKKPGETDLTAHVNFAALRAMTDPILKASVITQGDFLRGLGIEIRAHNLIKTHPSKAQEIKGQLHRLIDEVAMGQLFKVLLIYKDASPY